MRISDWSSDVCSSDLSPSQAGQAPCGALKLNRRGSISAMVKPETGQANFSEKTMRFSGIAAPLRLPPTCCFSPFVRSEEHTSGTPVTNAHLVCRLLLEKKKKRAPHYSCQHKSVKH